MAYIGAKPVNGFFAKQDITTDGSTTTFTLDFTIADETSIIVSVGGVLQEPKVAYNLSGGGTSIVFTAAPAATAATTATKASKYVNPYKSPGGAKPKTPTQKASDAKSKAAVISAGAAKVTKTTAMSVEAFAKLARRNVAKAKAILRNLGVKTGKTSNPRILAAKFRQYKARNK